MRDERIPGAALEASDTFQALADRCGRACLLPWAIPAVPVGLRSM